MKRTVAILSAMAVCGVAGVASAYHQPAFVPAQQQSRMSAQSIAQKAANLQAAAASTLGYGHVKAAAQNALKRVQRAAERFVRRSFGTTPAALFANAQRIKQRYQAARAAFYALGPSSAMSWEFAGIGSDLQHLEAVMAQAPAPGFAAPEFARPAPAFAAPATVTYRPYGQDVKSVVYKPYQVSYRPYAGSAPTRAVTVSWYRSY